MGQVGLLLVNAPNPGGISARPFMIPDPQSPNFVKLIPIQAIACAYMLVALRYMPHGRARGCHNPPIAGPGAARKATNAVHRHAAA